MGCVVDLELWLFGLLLVPDCLLLLLPKSELKNCIFSA